MQRLILIILIAIIVAVNINAQQMLTLEESISLVLKNNKELLAEKQSRETASWRQKNAFTNFLPKAYLNTSAVRIDDKSYNKAREIYKLPVFSAAGVPTGEFIPFSAGAMQGIYKTSYRTNIVVQQPLFVGGKITLGYQISRLANNLSDNSYIQKRNETVFQVTNLYFNILKLQELQELTNKGITSATAQMQRINQMKELGMAKESDILQWQVRVQDNKQTLREIDDNLITLIEMWNTMIGTENRIPAKIDAEQYYDEMERIADTDTDNYINESIKRVIDTNPLLNITEISRQISRKSYRMAKGNFLPNLNLQFSYDIDDGDTLDFSGNKSWNVAAVLSFPIFTGGANYTNLNIARSELRQTEIATSSAEEFLLIEARRIIRSQIRSARDVQGSKLNLTYIEANYKTLNELHRQGLLTNIELLDAESMLFAGEMQHISSIYDYILTTYELQKLMGLKEDK